MYPELFRIGFWPVRSYGVALALSFLLGALLARRRAAHRGIEPRVVLHVSVLALLATLAGARLAFVLVSPGEFREDPWRVVFPVDEDGVFRMTGLVMNGGVLATLLVVGLYLRIRRVPVLPVLDAMAPALGLGIFLTRIGCFLNGCCYGEPTERSWGVTFPPSSPAGAYQASLGEPLRALHPTQLYSAAYGLVILALVVGADRRLRSIPGGALWLTLLLYGVFRFLVEVLRHYQDERGMLAGFTHNQLTSLGLVLVSVTGLFLGLRARRHSRDPAPAADRSA